MNKINLNNKQALYFLWATILNQSQRADVTLKKTLELFERLDLSTNFEKSYPELNYDKILSAMTKKPAIHRFPKNMAQDLFFSLELIKSRYSNKPSLIFSKCNEPDYIAKELLRFKGIGNHKVDVAINILLYFINPNFISIKNENCASLHMTIDLEMEILKSLY